MTRRAAAGVAAAVVVVVAGWWMWSGGEERAVRARLNSLARQLNSSADSSLGAVAHAAELGTFFTDDIVVDLGSGAVPIVGRQTLVGMAARLQPQIAAFEVAFKDITVQSLADDTADVGLTVILTRDGPTASDRSIDAREFAVTLRKAGGQWQIARANAVDTLK